MPNHKDRQDRRGHKRASRNDRAFGQP